MDWCPRCRQPYVRAAHTGDFVHQCSSGDEALDNESVVVVGSWVDSDGSSGTKGAAEVMVGGCSNALQGDEASKWKQEKDRNVWGEFSVFRRERQHFEFIDKKD